MKLEHVRGTRSMYSSAVKVPIVHSKVAVGLGLSHAAAGALEPEQPIACRVCVQRAEWQCRGPDREDRLDFTRLNVGGDLT